MEKGRDKAEFENQDIQRKSDASAAVRCNSMGEDTHGGKQVGSY